MKTKFSKNGFVEELTLKDINIISPWGIETSDSAGFFSLNEKGCRQEIINKQFILSKNSLLGEIEVKLPKSHWKLEINESYTKTTISRSNKLVCLEDSEFNDFVSRFRFKKEFIDYVEINGERLIHKNSNLYYQYPVRDIKINLLIKLLLVLNHYKIL